MRSVDNLDLESKRVVGQTQYHIINPNNHVLKDYKNENISYYSISHFCREIRTQRFQ